MAAVLPLPDERDRLIKGRTAPEAPKIPGGPDLQVVENTDGSADIVEPGKEKKVETEFDANLADGIIDEQELEVIARDILDRVEHDKAARMKRDEQYEEGLKRTGLANDAPGGAQFTGASKATHPMLTEACIDFHASVMKELFPSGGPVKTEIIGEKTAEQLKVAERQARYMNWQLTEQIEEYREELSVTMTQLPMAGSQYMKFWDDETEDRTCTEFVPIDDLLVPYGCSSFWSAHRITHVQRLSEAIFEDRVDSGMYRDIEGLEVASATTPETTKSGQQSEKIEGADQPSENIDGIRLVYEVNCFLRLKADDEDRLPYLVSIDERTMKVLAIYRNWEEDDARRKRLHWIVDFGFIPWRGAYKIGYAHILGGLSAAATGALRALLDSALVQTIPVLAKLKSAKMGSQSKTVDPMTIQEVEAGVGVTDIRQALMALPFNPPSPVLYALVGWLTDAAKGVVTTAEEKIADAGNQMPMGTALALMESGAKVFSTIHAGLHASQRKALKILARLNKYRVASDEEQIEKFGEVIITVEDFRKPLGVIPVSDPNIFSEAQRYTQMQMVLGYAQGVDPKTGEPTATGKLHNLYECLKRCYELMKVPGIDQLLPPPKEPTELNAAAENAAVMLGNPITAFPEQEHLAHLETHMRFMMDPMLGGNPSAIAQAWPQMVEHIKQHLAMLYALQMYNLASEAAGQDISELMKDKSTWGKLDKMLAAASRIVHSRMSEVLSSLGEPMQQMIKKVEEMKMPPPMDPASAALQVAKMEDGREREKTQIDSQTKDKALQEKAKKDEADSRAKDEANRIKWEEIKLKYGQAKADAFAKNMTEQERLGMERAKTEHDIAVGQHGAQLNEQQQQHSQSMDHANRQREDQQAAHGQRMDAAGHELAADGQQHSQRLAEATAAHDQSMGIADHHLKAAESAHGQVMDVAGHESSVQNDQHARDMAEAQHAQQQNEHKDSVKQQGADRKAKMDIESARAKAAAKTKSQSTTKPKGKP